MTVAEVVVKLQAMPQDLPVCVADWNEQWMEPNELQAEIITVCEGGYSNGSELITGKFVCIGAE